MDSDWPEPGLAPGGSLAALLARRGVLSPGEVVTVVAPLAQALAVAHAAGRGHGAIAADTVEFTADGRPSLVAGGATLSEPDPAGDVAALAVVGWLALTGGAPDGVEATATSAPAALVEALRSAMSADPGERPAAALWADQVLRACAAEPVLLSVAPPRREPVGGPVAVFGAEHRLPLRRAALAGAGVLGLVMAVALGITWGRHGGPRAAALPPPPASTRNASRPSLPAASTEASAASWRRVVTRLEQQRMRAYATGDPGLLASLYDPASRAGARDVAMLRRLTRLGLRTRGFQPSVTAVVLQAASASRSVLRVEDALSAYDVVDPHGDVVVHGPARPARTFVLVLVEQSGSWRIATLRPA
jgi:hypothetical protein